MTNMELYRLQPEKGEHLFTITMFWRERNAIILVNFPHHESNMGIAELHVDLSSSQKRQFRKLWISRLHTTTFVYMSIDGFINDVQ